MSTRIRKILAELKAGKQLTTEQAEVLFTAQDRDLYAILQAAAEKKEELVGNQITYVINYNLNLTNICINNCRFCGFNTDLKSDNSYLLTKKELDQHLKRAKEYKVSEICLVSGLHPEFSFDDYLEIINYIKEQLPEVHLHGITPAELDHGLQTTGLDFKTGYQRLQAAGLDSVPGTAAEILVPQVRAKICPDKLTTQDWIRAIIGAHQAGLKSTATIMYGHLETAAQRIKHLEIIRNLQSKTGGFTEFIPLSFIHSETPLADSDKLNSGATGRQDLLMIAIARLFFDKIPNIQASWVKYGTKLAQFMLTAGANDLGGTLVNENISRQAGRRTREYLAPSEIERLIKDLGAQPEQRTTLYDKTSSGGGD